MLLVVTYSKAARQTLRNVCNSHDETVVRRFGRAALFEATAFGALLALRLQAKHEGDVQVERTEPFVPVRDAPEDVREAAIAYENREHASTPYAKFAAGRDVPSKTDLLKREL